MYKRQIADLLENRPIIAAIKDEDGLQDCLRCAAHVVFVLYGTLTTINDITLRIHEAGKLAMLHLDLVEGLSPREAAVDYVSAATQADGILTTKPALAARARQAGLLSVQRFFLLDSIAFRNLTTHIADTKADMVEVLPGVMPKVLARITQSTSVPVIAGGLISDKEDVVAALSAGAAGVSTSNPSLWNL